MTGAQNAWVRKTAFKDEMERRFQPDEAARIWADAERRLDGMFCGHAQSGGGLRTQTLGTGGSARGFLLVGGMHDLY